jgi:hypothetical protein
VGKCWQTNPEIIEGDDADESENETAWEKKSKQVFTNRFWRSFLRRIAAALSVVMQASFCTSAMKKTGTFR